MEYISPVWGRAISPDTRTEVEKAFGPLAADLVGLALMVENVDKIFLDSLKARKKGALPDGDGYTVIHVGRPLWARCGGRQHQEISSEQSPVTALPVMRTLYSTAAILFPLIDRPSFYDDLLTCLRFVNIKTPCHNASGELTVQAEFITPDGRIWKNRKWEYAGRCRDDGPRTQDLIDDLHRMAAQDAQSQGDGRAVLSKPMPKTRMMSVLGIDSPDTFNSYAERIGIKKVNHKLHQIRLDRMNTKDREKLEKA